VTTTHNVISIMAVDDHPVYREGIAAIIGAHPDLKLVAEAQSGVESVDLYRQYRPDVTIMDVQMPDMDGIEATEAIRREFPEARVIVLTTYKGDAQAVRALRAGASGYLLKNAVRKDLIDSIRAVHAGKRHILAEVAMEIAEHAAEETLSPREIEVLRYAAQGNANKRIAVIMRLSEETVKSHVASVLAKLQARDRSHAIAIALKRRIIDI
jgi:DNA-binding NarL/FixJ family response regulator